MNIEGRVLTMAMVPGRPEVVPALRALVGTVLASHPALDDIRLMATEMISNVIRHTRSGEAGGVLTLAVLDVGHATRVEVVDQEPPPAARTAAVMWTRTARTGMACAC